MADIGELRERWNKLAQVGRENDLDLILVYFDEYNMADACYLTNIWTQFERGLVAISVTSGDPCLLVGPETANFVMTHMPELESRVISLFLAWGAAYPNTSWEDTSDVLTELAGGPPHRIGLVGSGFLPLTLYQALSSMADEIVDITDSVHRARQIKSASEIDKIRTAYRIVDAGLEAMLNRVTPGMTEAALAGVGEAAMRAAGAEGYAYSTILSSQERTNSVFGRPTQRPLDNGSLLAVSGWRGAAFRSILSAEAKMFLAEAFVAVVGNAEHDADRFLNGVPARVVVAARERCVGRRLALYLRQERRQRV